MPPNLSCPFCNAVFPAPQPLPPSGRVTCPLCEETFVPRSTTATEATTTAPLPRTRTQPATRRPLWVAGTLTVFAAVAVGMVLLLRNGDEPAPNRDIDPDDRPLVAPAELAALGYLPADTDAILALQLTPLLERTRTSGQPGAADLTQLGIPPALLNGFERATGLKPADLHSIVLGLKLDDRAIPPRLVTVVRTREAFDAAALRELLKAKPLERGGRTLDAVKPEGSPVEMVLWFPTDRVIVAAFLADDFDAVPSERSTGIGRFKSAVAELIRDRLPAESPAWMVVHSEAWEKAALPQFLLAYLDPKANPKALAEFRSVAVAVSADADPTVRAQVRLSSPERAADARRLVDRIRAIPGVTEVGGEGDWLSVVLRAERNTVVQVLRQLRLMK